MIPTLSARGRQRLLQDLARGELSGYRHPLDREPPVGLASYLKDSRDRPESVQQQAAPAPAVPGQGLELVLWLGLLLFDGALALLDLLQSRQAAAQAVRRGNREITMGLPPEGTGGQGKGGYPTLAMACVGTVDPLSCC